MPSPGFNTAAETFLNAAADQAKGKTVISQQDFDDLIQEAGSATVGEKEQFLGQLTGRIIDTMYTDAAWTDKYNDVFFENSERFGAIVQIINTEMPEVRKNSAWDAITGGSIVIGSNTAYVPVVKEQLVGGTSSWGVPFCMTGTQMDSAFTSAEGLSRFFTYVQMSAENAVKYHLARMSAANRNNYIMEKLNKGNTATNINYVNLVAEYNAMTGSSIDAQQFLNNQNGCLRSVYKAFKKYKALLTDMTTMFSLDSTTNGKFIPEDRFVFIMLADFAALLETELYSTTYHENFVRNRGYREVPSWQGLRQASSSLTFADLSRIDAKRDNSVIDEQGASIAQSGVVGLMVDKWAIIHTIVRHRMGVQRDDIKDITLYEHQFTDRYINNLMLNGLVFVVQ